MILLISNDAKWFAFGLAFLLLIISVSIVAYMIRTAECYEHDSDPIDIPGEDMEPVNYRDIMNCERPYIEHQYN